jgi:hypothetical protein
LSVLAACQKPEPVVESPPTPSVEQKRAERAAEVLTLTVYQVATPPRKIGVAHVDGQTSEATYTAM